LETSRSRARWETRSRTCAGTRSVFTHYLSSSAPSPPTLGHGPFPEPAADFTVANINTQPCTKWSSSFAPQLGQQATTGGVAFNGLIDDVRVITGALPCN
jgi:hypothetical protein